MLRRRNSHQQEWTVWWAVGPWEVELLLVLLLVLLVLVLVLLLLLVFLL